MPPTTPTLQPGNLDPLYHGQGLVVACETCPTNLRRCAVLEAACLRFAFDRRTGAVLGLLQAFSDRIDPGFHTRLDLRRLRGVLQGVEFVVAHGARLEAESLVPLVPALAALPWLCTARGLPWRAFGHAETSLQGLASHHGIAWPQPPSAEAEARALLELIGRPSPLGPTYLGLLLSEQAWAA